MMWMLSSLLILAASASPNVLMLSVDTLRADHLGCYGYTLPTSPHIDALARNARLFEDCTCEVPLTNPSFGSMMTSRFPRLTGTWRNALPMPDSIPLVAEQFQKAGYQTFCVQSNWTLTREKSHLDRGFDIYDDKFNTKRWGVAYPERYADKVTDIALKLLQERKPDVPFFAWIHYSDPHAPYRFHEDYNPWGKKQAELAEPDKTRARYDSEVAFTDAQIGRLLEKLPENTYILFIADHGESLHEHDYLGHGRRVYRIGTHIPFFITGPGITPERITVPVRAIDVGPTLLGLARLPVPKTMMGIDLTKKLPKSNRIRVLETYGGAVPNLPGIHSLLENRPPMRQSVLADGWQLILGGPKTELFQFSRDPLEVHNLAKQFPEKVKQFRALIEEWNKKYPPLHRAAVPLNEEDIQTLEAGGYL